MTRVAWVAGIVAATIWFLFSPYITRAQRAGLIQCESDKSYALPGQCPEDQAVERERLAKQKAIDDQKLAEEKVKRDAEEALRQKELEKQPVVLLPFQTVRADPAQAKNAAERLRKWVAANDKLRIVSGDEPVAELGDKDTRYVRGYVGKLRDGKPFIALTTGLQDRQYSTTLVCKPLNENSEHAVDAALQEVASGMLLGPLLEGEGQPCPAGNQSELSIYGSEADTVTVNGVPHKETFVHLRFVTPGNYLVEARAPHYKRWKETVVVGEDEDKSVSVDLTKGKLALPRWRLSGSFDRDQTSGMAAITQAMSSGALMTLAACVPDPYVLAPCKDIGSGEQPELWQGFLAKTPDLEAVVKYGRALGVDAVAMIAISAGDSSMQTRGFGQYELWLVDVPHQTMQSASGTWPYRKVTDIAYKLKEMLRDFDATDTE